MSIQYGQFCPIAKAAEIIGERWTLLILRELLLGSTRYNELQRALSQISPTLLSKRLAQLEDHGLLLKRAVSGAKRFEYQLTPSGRQLEPVLMGLGEWGMRWARGQMTDDELDVELLMTEFKRRSDTDQLPSGRVVVKFYYPELDQFSVWWIVFEEDGSRELCVNNPGKETDLTITADLRAMTEIWAGDLTVNQAKKAGRLKLAGNPVIGRTLSSWLGISLLAHVK